MRSARAFVNERTGLFDVADAAAATPVTGGPALRHALFPATVALFALATATGVALALHYAPTMAGAWASLVWFEREIPLGTLIRAVHVHSAGAVVIVIALHLVQVALSGTYRKPREVEWWLSLALALVAVGFGMTGTILRMDEHGWWASRVEMGIVGSTPLLGDASKALFLGGNEAGNLTLARHYILHVIVLPGAMAGVIWLHLRQIARNGLLRSLDAPLTESPWWPSQAARDLAVALLACTALVFVASLLGAPIGAPADPSAGYSARPVWYFRPLFVLRMAFEGPLEPIATLVLPGLFGGFLASLPFILKPEHTSGRRRLLAAPLVGVVLLSGAAIRYSYAIDDDDAAYQKQVTAGAKVAAKAHALAWGGVPAQGPLFMLNDTPEERGKRLFGQKCAGCHAVSGVRGGKGPDLAGYANHTWLVAVIAHPEADEFFGKTKVTGMEPYEALGPRKLGDLATFLQALRTQGDMKPDAFTGPLADGYKLFDGEGCTTCHSVTPGVVGDAGPNLAGYASDAWLIGLMKHPADPMYFGEDNSMPSYEKKFEDRQFTDVIAYLRVLEALPPQFGSPPPPTAPAAP